MEPDHPPASRLVLRLLLRVMHCEALVLEDVCVGVEVGCGGIGVLADEASSSGESEVWRGLLGSPGLF